jgi:hypothetical protein
MTQVFISYSRSDMEFVQRLAMDLNSAGLDVWWDLSDIQGSDVWERKIEEGLNASNFFIVVLSPASLDSRWVRREYLSADNKGIKIIPLKLKTYDEVPLTLRDIQPIDAIDRPYADVLSDVLRILKVQVQAKSVKDRGKNNVPVSGEANLSREASNLPERKSRNRFIESLLSKGTSGVDVGGTLLLVAYFLLASFELLGPSDDALKPPVILSAILSGLFLLIKKHIPGSMAFKIAAILYLFLRGWEFYGDYYGGVLQIDIVQVLAGLASIIITIVLIFTVQTPKKPVFYAAISFALFFFLIATKLTLNLLSYDVPWIYVPITIVSIITAILLWLDL